jgi:hypothetical protein
MKERRNQLAKRARKGLRGYPIATVAYYGPTDAFATKVAVGIVLEEGEETAFLERWFSKESDIRHNAEINDQIIEFIKEHGARSVVMADSIVGCPHEEGIDYPEGEACPECPFWATRERWTGETIQ